MKLYKPKPIKWVHKLKAISVTHVYNIVPDLDKEPFTVFYHELHSGETGSIPLSDYDKVVKWIEKEHSKSKLLDWFDIEEVND